MRENLSSNMSLLQGEVLPKPNEIDNIRKKKKEKSKLDNIKKFKLYVTIAT